jgi:uncharacterized membrane protein
MTETATRRNPLLDFLAALGPLRIALVIAALALIAAAPDPGTRAVFHGFGVITTVIVPATAPILFMVLLLDALMSAVFMQDKQGAERARYRHIAFLNLALAAALVIAWYPFFRSIAS